MKHSIKKVKKIWNKFLKLDLFTVDIKYADGNKQTIERFLVQGSNAASIFLYDKKNNLTLMVEQFRIGMVYEDNANSLECPAGLIDDGENASDAIIREVLEETGLDISSFPLKQVSKESFISCGTMTQTLSIFSCNCDLSNVKEGIYGTDDEEYIHTKLIPYTEMVRRLRDLEIKHVSQIAAIQSTLIEY
jgi:ADP-ribose pyrophosphatase